MQATAQARIRAPDYDGRAADAATYILESIVEPKSYVVPGYERLRFAMPSFAHLDESEIDALVQFLLQQ